LKHQMWYSCLLHRVVPKSFQSLEFLCRFRRWILCVA
jgi:hypothetical protein